MKKVAVVMESWKRYFTYAWPSGMLQRIKETDEDISLYIFNSSANWSSDEKYNKGEYNIFNLPDFRDFDGVVIDLNNTIDDDVRQKVLKRIRESGTPGIVINNRYDGFYSVGIDNYMAMRKIMEHLYEHHNSRTFWFVLGPEGNYENSERKRAICDYIKEKKVPKEAYEFYSEDFDYNTGVIGFKELYSRNGNLPDAVVCANDNIAVGVLAEAEKRGFSIPEDFIVTGFDDLDKSRYYTPRISTMSYTREDAGYECINMFLDIWNGREPESYRHTKAKPIFWESCGCESDIEVNPRLQLKGNMLWNIEQEYFEGCKLALDSRLGHAKTIEEMIACIPESIPVFRCDAMYQVVDRHLIGLDYVEADVDKAKKAADIDAEFKVNGYPDEMMLALAYGDDKVQGVEGDKRMIKGLFPLFDSEEKGQNYLFLPLHFRDKCIGYFAIKNAIYLMEQQFLFAIINSLTSGMEQLFFRSKLAYLNSALSVLYNHDSMTGLYNRLGYTEYAEEFYRKLKENGESIVVIYIDLDKLKNINDDFGHEVGDYAIKTIARLSIEVAAEGGLCFRLGGDEFLVLDKYISKEDTEKKLLLLDKRLKETSKEEKLPVMLSASTGYAVGKADEDYTLDMLVQKADDIMYQSKVARHMNRV
ncbi:MAG: GGDEF domain-containing protein [Lachnospiraceae bacterium]|nr:GGDEF domain-containing protein [Lachnospiraceae bacterium]